MAATQETLVKRAETLRIIRQFFHERGYIEMETPVALAIPGQEPYLHPVPVALTDDTGASHQYYLRTSPEYALKKLLASGFKKIFNIGPCFRDRESFGGSHQPEFTMLEWYAVGMTYTELMDEVDALLAVVAEPWRWRGVLPAKRLSMRELFLQHAGTDLDTWQNMSTIEYEQNFFDIFLNQVEPNLPKEPVMVYDYPVQLGALARRRADNPAYVERFELYMSGLELANAFGELLDAHEQRARFEEEQRIRAARFGQPFPLDEAFLAALKRIPEPTSGIALGIDRLIMAFSGASSIEDVIAFPFST